MQPAANALRAVARAAPLPLRGGHRVAGDLVDRQVVVGAAPGQVHAVVAGQGEHVGLALAC
jgi:hypothetical protein